MGMGKRIKAILEDKKMTISELADLIGMPRTSLYSTIKRDSDYMSLNNLHKIAAALDVSIYDLQGVSWMDKVADINRANRENTHTLLNYYHKLNDLGKEEAVKRISELTELKKYTKKDKD